ncbi:MAG: hypothetical protein AAB494_01030 [Patescibacteria group bacterium]
MAITFEEEKKRINWPMIISVIFILALIATSIIYLFFISPEKTEVLVSPKLQNISEVSKIALNFDQLTNSEAFKNLKEIVIFNIPSPENIGKANPFLP